MNITITNVSKTINKDIILDDINLSLTGGKIYGLTGQNGCGKTMLMRLICGLIHPTKGKVYINGDEIGKNIDFPLSIGLLLENPSFLDKYNGYDNLKILADLKGNIDEQEIINTLQNVGLNPRDKKKYYKYSLGMKQRLGIAAAIMGKPDLILLDEPINAIDKDGVSEILKVIKSLKSDNRIVIVACHSINELEEIADEIINMSSGKIVE